MDRFPIFYNAAIAIEAAQKRLHFAMDLRVYEDELVALLIFRDREIFAVSDPDEELLLWAWDLRDPERGPYELNLYDLIDLAESETGFEDPEQALEAIKACLRRFKIEPPEDDWDDETGTLLWAGIKPVAWAADRIREVLDHAEE